MEPIDHFENGRHVGRTNFSQGLLISSIEAAVKRVDGVARLKSDSGFRFRNLFSPSAWRSGVAVRSVGYGVIVLEVCVQVHHGYAAADLSYRIQEAVLSVAQNKNITDKRIKRVNVRICDVIIPKPEQQQLSI